MLCRSSTCSPGSTPDRNSPAGRAGNNGSPPRSDAASSPSGRKSSTDSQSTDVSRPDAAKPQLVESVRRSNAATFSPTPSRRSAGTTVSGQIASQIGEDVVTPRASSERQMSVSLEPAAEGVSRSLSASDVRSPRVEVRLCHCVMEANVGNSRYLWQRNPPHQLL